MRALGNYYRLLMDSKDLIAFRNERDGKAIKGVAREKLTKPYRVYGHYEQIQRKPDRAAIFLARCRDAV